MNALIVNPAFDSQTKETLTLKVSSFGSKCDLSEQFLKKVINCGVVENILSWAAFRQSKGKYRCPLPVSIPLPAVIPAFPTRFDATELKKNDGAKRQRLLGIPKLDDANDAGGRSSEHCTLILTEGDSAKALAISGLSVVGRRAPSRLTLPLCTGGRIEPSLASHQAGIGTACSPCAASC